MSLAAGILGGAQNRLLPATIPFRFFLSAAGFHVLAWAVLLLAADEVAGFRGGPGLTLAAIHLVTLGTLAMAAIGASLQLFPVVTRRALTRNWPGHLSFAFMLPGVILMSWGMATYQTTAMRLGGALASAGLAVFAVLTADNLRRASSIPVVAAHGWLALTSLFAVTTMGVLLIWDFGTGFLVDHGAIAIAHMALASFGFMGFLILGLSLVLIPMFVLSRSPPQRLGWMQLTVAALGVAAFSVAVLGGRSWLIWLAFAAGFAASGLYLWQMMKVLKSRMRKRLGLPFLLIRVSWGFLVLTMLLIALFYAQVPIPNAPSLIGFVLLAGWLLTFLFGVMQRIMPFLASMHASGKSGLPPMPSELTAQGPLKLHAICHFAALFCCGLGIVVDQGWIIQIGAAFGLIGAVGFAVFAVNVALKVRQNSQSN